tara:strand:- start:569 stop:727 length:159 start_codon:yes stop_codon:yes gene_type:complete
MRIKDTIKAAKKIIKARKKNKKLYTKEEVKYAKLLKRRAEEKLEEKHANDNT